MPKISMPVKSYVEMPSPYAIAHAPIKHRFYGKASDVPSELLDWMQTNPRKQNLTSSVAQAISTSLMDDNHEFHLRNRGILLSAKEVSFVTNGSEVGSGVVTIDLERDTLHGNIDGGHTLRLILQAQADPTLPEQYVEFEVITGLDTALNIAEARNTSVALDMRTLEDMKGSYEVLKGIFQNIEIMGNRFFDRVEIKMNEQLEEQNRIDVRNLISIILMFNQDLYPNHNGKNVDLNSHPRQMYGGKEAALKKYLELGGSSEARDAILKNMAPVLPDIINLWDCVERELPLVAEKKYKALRFGETKKNPHTLFSNVEVRYYVPQSILFPVVAAFRSLIAVDEQGKYGWVEDPIDVWNATKSQLVESILSDIKKQNNNHNAVVRKDFTWSMLYTTVLLHRHRSMLMD